MRSKALHRIYHTPLGLIVLLMAGILIAALVNINVLAAGNPTVTVEVRREMWGRQKILP